MEIKTSILDYLGKFEGGIMVLIALSCDSEYYEGIFYYTSESIVFSVDDRFEEKIGSKIEKWLGYSDLLRGILKDIVPFSQMINRIDDVDFSKFALAKEGEIEIKDEINPSEIIQATMSSDR